MLDEARRLHEKRSRRLKGLIDGTVEPAEGSSREEEVTDLTRKLMSISEIMLRFG